VPAAFEVPAISMPPIEPQPALPPQLPPPQACAARAENNPIDMVTATIAKNFNMALLLFESDSRKIKTCTDRHPTNRVFRSPRGPTSERSRIETRLWIADFRAD
jgi:hypothetical protein